MLFNYISQVTNEENLFNNQNFSLTDHFLSSHDQGEILCWSMEGLKGEGLKKKTAFKQQMTLKQQMT